MLVWIAATALAAHVQPTMDCGERRYAQEIGKAHELAIHEAGFAPYIGEMPTPAGHFECVRFTFSVDSQGRAANVDVAESSGDYMLILDARRTLERYRFAPHPGDGTQRYTLVFSGVVNKAPPPPIP
jgi:TonB family protein